MQRRIARQRPSLNQDSYVAEFARSKVSEAVSRSIYEYLEANCTKGVAPHPDDGLCGFYFDDPEDMEDFIEEIFNKLGLPNIGRYEPETSAHLNSARDFGIYMQSKINN